MFMESIKTLREICQAPRREVDNWRIKHIARKPSIYITWVLLHTPITATGATFLFLLTGLIASAIFIFGTRYAFLTGSILLQLWYIMDMVDGEIARYKKQTSQTGIYFECIVHYIVHFFVFISIGLGLYRHYTDPSMLLASILAGYSVCMITASSDVFDAVLYQKICRGLQKSSGTANVLKNESITAKKEQSIFKKAFSALHLISTFPFAMDAILLVSIVNLFTPYNLMIPLVRFYAVSATFVWIARVFVFIKTKKIDRKSA